MIIYWDKKTNSKNRIGQTGKGITKRLINLTQKNTRLAKITKTCRDMIFK